MNLVSKIKQGFTLIELLIVIAIIGILTALVTTNLQGARSRARDTRRKSDLRAIEQSLRLYYNDNKSFPVSSNSQIVGCDGSPCNWGGPFTSSATIYMPALPFDPASSISSPVYYKYFSNGDDSTLLVSSLENASDEDITLTQTRCAGPYNDFKSAGGASTTTDYLLCAQ